MLETKIDPHPYETYLVNILSNSNKSQIIAFQIIQECWLKNCLELGKIHNKLNT